MKRLLLISSILATSAMAHHGRDLILLQDATVPATGDWITFSNFSFSSQKGPNETVFEAGATTGILPRTSLTATMQYADLDGGGWGWSAATPSLQFDLTPTGSPVMMGFLIGREFALGDEHEHGTHEELDHDHDGEHQAHGTVEHNEDHHGHDEDQHEHTGIHQHGIDAYHARFIVEGTLRGGTRLVGNLVGLIPDDGDAAVGYGVGIIHPLNHHLSLGLEVTGDFSTDEYQEAAVGVYYSPVHAVTLKLGVGAGLNSESPDLTLRTGLTWKF